MIDQKGNQIYSIEYSQWSMDHNLFPWHWTTLEDAIHKNRIDMVHNNRGNNKWQIVFIGSLDACINELERLVDKFGPN